MSGVWVIKRLAVVCVVLLLALTYVARFRLGDAAPFPDLEPLSLPLADILDFPNRLKFAGRELYSNTYLPLDCGFIVLLTGLLLLIAKALRPRRLWWAVALFGLVYFFADLVENYHVAQLVWGNGGDQAMIFAERIHWATRIKFAALLLAGASILHSWRQEVPS